MEDYMLLYYMGKSAAAAAVTYAVIQGVTLLGVLDGLSDDSEFSKNQNRHYAKNLLEDANGAICRICFYGARRAAELIL